MTHQSFPYSIQELQYFVNNLSETASKSSGSHSIVPRGQPPISKNSFVASTPTRNIHETTISNYRAGKKTNAPLTPDDNLIRKEEIIRKLLESQRTLGKNLDKAVNERDKAIRQLSDLQAVNLKLTLNYEKNLRYLEEIPPEALDDEIREAQKICENVLKSTSGRMSTEVGEDYSQEKQSLLHLQSSSILGDLRKRAASIQTEDLFPYVGFHEHKHKEELEVDKEQESEEDKEQEQEETLKLMRKLQMQNQQLRLRLKKSQELRSTKLASLRSIVSKTNGNKSGF